MAGHTPGPWEKNGLQISKHGRGIIADIRSPQKGGAFECMNNLDLLFAAPELKEALQAIENHCRNTNDLKGLAHAEEGHAVRKQAQAALAKSEGRNE